MSFYDSHKYMAVSMARGRIDAITGVTALGIGFFLQAVGYTASLAVVESDRSGSQEAVVGIALLVVSAALVFLAGFVHQKSRLMPTLIEMSRFTADGTREDFPRATLLPGWLEAIGLSRPDDEDDLAYVRRVAGVGDLVVNVAPKRKRLASEPKFPDET